MPVNTNNNFSISHWFRSGTGQLALAALFLVGVYLVAEHTSHVLGLLPYALLFLCPLLHLFMHRGHGDHNGDPPSGGAGSRNQDKHVHLAIQNEIPQAVPVPVRDRHVHQGEER